MTVSRPYTGTVHQFGTFMSEKLPNTSLKFTTRLILWWCTDGRKGVTEEAGGAEQQHIAEAAPNELKLGEGR